MVTLEQTVKALRYLERTGPDDKAQLVDGKRLVGVCLEFYADLRVTDGKPHISSSQLLFEWVDASKDTPIANFVATCQDEENHKTTIEFDTLEELEIYILQVLENAEK